MNTFLNQWSTRAICMYASRSKPTRRSATVVVVVEDMTKPFKRRHCQCAVRVPNGRVGDDGRRHVGGGGAGGVGVRPIADIQNLRWIELPLRAGNEEPAGVRLERADFWIATAQHEREVVSDAERLELFCSGVVRQNPETD